MKKGDKLKISKLCNEAVIVSLIVEISTSLLGVHTIQIQAMKGITVVACI